MEDQVPSSNIPGQPTEQQPVQPAITAEQLQEMKRMALENAIRQQKAMQQQQAPIFNREPEVVYVRRNLTIAELLLVIALSCGIVTGVQATWNFATDFLPRIEIREK
jgi:hypothetical protein